MESSRPRILYVEDDRDLALLVQECLRGAGYDVEIAYDGAEGLAMSGDRPYDLIALDFDLPVHDGLEIVRTLSKRRARTPIVMLTACSDQSVVGEALRLGVAEYVFKDSQGGYLTLLPPVIRRVLDQRRLLEEKRRMELALAQSEERYRSLVEITSDCVWEVDVRGTCTYVSPRVEAMLGCEPAEILGTRLFEVLQGSEARRVLRLAGKSIRRREAILNLVTSHRHRRGHLVILETSAVPIFDGDGAYCGYRGVDRDVTRRRQAEESLRVSEQKFRGVVDNIAVGISVINRRMEITFLNRQMREWFPKIEPSLLPVCHSSFHEPAQEEICKDCPTAQTFTDGEVHEVVQEVPGPDGVRFYRIVASPIRDERGEVVAAIELVDDVTARFCSERLLEESERLMRQVLDTNPNLIFAKDVEGRYVLANQSTAALYGMTPAEMIGKTDDYFVDRGCIQRETVEQFRREDARVITGQEPIAISEQGLEMPDGTTRWYQVSKSPLTVGLKSRCVLGVAVDITERKRMEHNLAQAQKLEAVGQLAAGIAHEINTPIQYIGDNTRFLREAFQGFGNLLPVLERLIEACRSGSAGDEILAEVEKALRESDADYLAEEVPRAVQQSLEGVNRVARIVRAIKEFAHPGSEEKQAIDLNRAVENALTLARNEWKYVAEMVTDFDQDLPPVHCLPSDVNQVVLNLVINAAQAIAGVVGDRPEGKGTITVSTRRDGPWAEIGVQDTGTGIAREIRGKIFNPFFTTKEIGQGTGQGLSIAHSLVVDKHGGTIEFETEVGRGTTFSVRLPIDGQPACTRKGITASS